MAATGRGMLAESDGSLGLVQLEEALGGRLSKARNAVAHPDVELVGAIAGAFKEQLNQGEVHTEAPDQGKVQAELSRDLGKHLEAGRAADTFKELPHEAELDTDASDLVVVQAELSSDLEH